MLRTLLALLVLTLPAAAADISGNWKGTADTPNGKLERTFIFKVDGTKLTGETNSQMMGKSEIKNGKVDGDNVTFTIEVNFQGNAAELHYKGKVEGETIKFTVEFASGGGNTVKYVTKRVS